jgi:hypothetical protein
LAKVFRLQERCLLKNCKNEMTLNFFSFAALT